MKIVLDTNVWLSALLWGGLPDQITQLAEAEQVQIYSSELLLWELENTLKRQKIQQRMMLIGVTEKSVYLAVRQIISIVPIENIEIPQLRDPKDAMVIATAIASGSSKVVSGDQDLLILQEFKGIQILTPRQFLDEFLATPRDV